MKLSSRLYFKVCMGCKHILECDSTIFNMGRCYFKRMKYEKDEAKLND